MVVVKGEKNGQWKGDKVGYFGMHRWVEYYKPKPELCEHCNERSPKDLSNISGEYKRDLKDYEWLCRKCHMLIDGRTKPLKPCLTCKKPTKNKYYCSCKCDKRYSKKKGNFFFCPGCKRYLLKNMFNKSSYHKYRISTFCKRCISQKYYLDKRI